MITNPGAHNASAMPNPQPMHTGARGFDHSSNHWANGLLGIEPRIGQQIVHIIAGILGTAAALLFISTGFNLMKTGYAIFGGIACSMLAGLVESLGQKLFASDPASVIAGNTKLQAALAMSVGPARDQTLMKVAREAVEEGESQVAHLALQSIQDVKIRDEAAGACAFEIANNEGTEEALPVARMIQDNALRNEVLQKLVEM